MERSDFYRLLQWLGMFCGLCVCVCIYVHDCLCVCVSVSVCVRRPFFTAEKQVGNRKHLPDKNASRKCLALTSGLSAASLMTTQSTPLNATSVPLCWDQGMARLYPVHTGRLHSLSPVTEHN